MPSKKYGLIILLCLITTFFSRTAWSEPHSGYFFGFNAGSAYPGEFTSVLENNYSAGLQYGYRDTHFRTALAVDYMRNDLSDLGAEAYNFFTIMTNFYYDFNENGTIVPFVGTGVGYAELWKNDCFSTDGQCTELPTGSKLAYQGLLGLGLQQEHVRFDVQYRYMNFAQSSGLYENIIECVFNIFI